MLGQTGEHLLLVMFSHAGRYTTQKSLARGVLGHAADVTANQLHRIAAITAKQAVAILRLAGRAVDDGNEVICDDDAVFAFRLWILRDEVLFDYLHECFGLYTRRNTDAEPVSRPAYGR